ncbi:hypothetical protein [Amycolatopsis palatopharyngis]|uniref:hypothetical protein n=1 Tax=Amycolatopsis palatopharyngis TaxID=187982 RepID=UPI0013BEA075|nr:hypothetical protein [Amycolatopsis palatopharyngis]
MTGKTGKCPDAFNGESSDVVAERMVDIAWTITSSCGVGRRRAARSVSRVVPRLNWSSLADDPTGREVRDELITEMAAVAGRRGRRAFAEAAGAAVARDELNLLPSPQRELLTGVLVDHLDLAHAAERASTPAEQAPVLLRTGLAQLSAHI